MYACRNGDGIEILPLIICCTPAVHVKSSALLITLRHEQAHDVCYRRRSSRTTVQRLLDRFADGKYRYAGDKRHKDCVKRETSLERPNLNSCTFLPSQERARSPFRTRCNRVGSESSTPPCELLSRSSFDSRVLWKLRLYIGSTTIQRQSSSKMKAFVTGWLQA